jgi:leucyl-tRNA synthetase
MKSFDYAQDIYDHTKVEARWPRTKLTSRRRLTASRSRGAFIRGKQSVPYNHQSIETKWQEHWEHIGLNRADIDSANKPFYNLMMFPYPSAEGLHVGNMYAFTGSDIYGRFKRMQGYDVFEPIGLDGFGIHSENYALKINRHPMDHATITEKNYYAQLRKIGAMFDWDRTVETYDPQYYRWTQWLFTQMFKHGLAYRAKSDVNWCPSCKTVLADEQVLSGSCERCGEKAQKRALEQWFFRITAYAEKLLQNSFTLDWSDKVRVAQKNWIGKKEGINITYPVFDQNDHNIGEISCFTTRPDTNHGATFIVMSPEHSFITQILTVIEKKKREIVKSYITAAAHKSDEDRIAEGRKKTGVATGCYCVNQLTNDKIPLYISDFVLTSFGTGAVVGVPGHDIRDYEFAMQFDIPVKRVVVGTNGDTTEIKTKEQVQEDEGTMVNSGFLNGLDVHKATEKIMDYLEEKGWGKRVTTYHLRDWLISRQRYWGPPIPMIHCKKCGWQPVPDDQLPVILPRIEDYRPGNDGIAPLAKHTEFYHTTCPKCQGEARRETDVSDTFLDSSWYFLRYPSVNTESGIMNHESGRKQHIHNSQFTIHDSKDNVDNTKNTQNLPWDLEITKKWLPVHMYTGGAEHSVLHLMYSRFVTMALKDWGYIDFEEPFTSFFAHGLVIKDGAKMSKSKGNVVNPDEYIVMYGADALRMYLMFMGPFDQGGDFRDAAMEGMHRWVGRIWRLAQASDKRPASRQGGQATRDKQEAKTHAALHKLIKKVTDDMEKRRYNTTLASMMEFTNLVEEEGGVMAIEDLKNFTLLLAPFAPHLTEELWQQITNNKEQKTKNKSREFISVHVQPWPTYDEKMLKEESVVIVIQVNGKLRDQLTVASDQSSAKEAIEKLARASENVARHLAEKSVKKVIFIPGKILNFVAI